MLKHNPIPKVPTSQPPTFLAKDGRWAITALTLGLLLGAPAGAELTSAAAKTFEPSPEDVFIQRVEHNKTTQAFGDTIVSLRLGQDEMDRLAHTTGRVDLFAMGAQGSTVVMRDDGVFPDAVAGDAEFSTLAFINEDHLQDRAQRQDGASLKNKGANLKFGADRQLEGTVPVDLFNSVDFDRGDKVPLDMALSTLAAPTPGFANPFQLDVLMITHPGVLTDPGRTIDPCTAAPIPGPPGGLPAWSFGKLMADMANRPMTGIDPRIFVESWLNHWLAPQVINGFNVPARPAMANLINNWRAASGGGRLDLSIAPFRLIAINPRMDLRETAGGTSFLNAGEGRFVFAVVDPFSGPGCRETPFTVILEYGVPLASCLDVRQWGLDWEILSTMPPGSPIYNNHLQGLTDLFATAGADPSKPNQSSINQVRTNENELNPLWEMREFRLLNPTPSMLSQTVMADTPDFSFNFTPTVNATIGAGTINPAILGGAAIVPTPNTFWDGNPTMPGPASGRHDFSFATCSGCHAGETDTFFVHINPSPTLLPFVPMLSDFLTGTNIIDPAGGSNTVDPVDGTLRFFDDLDRRQVDLSNLVGMVCITVPVTTSVTDEFAFTRAMPSHSVKPATVDMSFDLLMAPGIDTVH